MELDVVEIMVVDHYLVMMVIVDAVLFFVVGCVVEGDEEAVVDARGRAHARARDDGVVVPEAAREVEHVVGRAAWVATLPWLRRRQRLWCL